MIQLIHKYNVDFLMVFLFLEQRLVLWHLNFLLELRAWVRFRISNFQLIGLTLLVDWISIHYFTHFQVILIGHPSLMATGNQFSSWVLDISLHFVPHSSVSRSLLRFLFKVAFPSWYLHVTRWVDSFGPWYHQYWWCPFHAMAIILYSFFLYF